MAPIGQKNAYLLWVPTFIVHSQLDTSDDDVGALKTATLPLCALLCSLDVFSLIFTLVLLTRHRHWRLIYEDTCTHTEIGHYFAQDSCTILLNPCER